MKVLPLITGLLTAVLAAPTNAQQVYGLFGLGGTEEGHRQLGRFDPGVSLTLFGSPTSIATTPVDTASAHVAYDFRASKVYFVGRAGNGPASIYTVDGVTGIATVMPLAQLALSDLIGIDFDRRTGMLGAIFTTTAGEYELRTIDPATGNTTLIGGPPGGTTVRPNYGVITGDDGDGRMFFLGRTGGAAGNLFVVDRATGDATIVSLSGSQYNRISGLEYDEDEQVLYAVVAVSGGRQLATIDTTTGAVTLIGSEVFGGSGTLIKTIQGTTSLDAARNKLLCVGQIGNGWRFIEVDTATGDAVLTPISQAGIRAGAYIGLQYATGAACQFRNGTGVNPADYTCLTPPTAGAKLHLEVATNPSSFGAAVTLTAMSQLTVPFQGYEVLLDPTLPCVCMVGSGTFEVDLPPIVGTWQLSSQAFRFDGIGGVTTLVLTNAQDLWVAN